MKQLPATRLTQLLGLALLTVFSPVGNADTARTVSLQPPAANDLIAKTVQATESMQILNRSNSDVMVSWPLPNNIELAPVSSYRASSKAYWLTVSNKQLQQGVRLQTTAPGAVIQLSPLQSANGATTTLNAPTDSSPPDSSRFTLTDKQGKQYPLTTASALSVSTAQLNNTAISFAPGGLIVQLKDSLGSGEFILRSNTTVSSTQATNTPAYNVYVLDKNSKVSLSLQTISDTVFSGQTLRAKISMLNARQAVDIKSIEVFLRTPDGKIIDAGKPSIKQGYIEISKQMDNRKNFNNTGLWELHVKANSVMNGLTIRRHAKTSFAYTRPNASIGQSVTISKSPDAKLNLTFNLQAASSGRFELRGTLYATNQQHQQVPIMYGNSAGWRAAGNSKLQLTYDLNKIDRAAFSAPYEIRDLRLLDQSRMMLLHRQQKALVINQ